MIMKRIIYALPVIASFMLVSCRQELEGTLYRPNTDDAKEIHFNVSSLVKTFAEDDKAGIIELSVVRPGNLGNHTVFLAQMGSDENVFSFPESATIADGDYSVVVPVLVDLKKCVKGSSYATTLYIVARDQATGNYGVKNNQYADAVDISVSIELTWEPLMIVDEETGEEVQQTATYTYDGFWHGVSDRLPVEKAACEDIIYRVSGWGTSETYFMWQVKDDGSCVVPKQNTGYFNSSYNQYIFVSDYPNNVNGNYSYKSYPCTFDGDRTYSFTLIYYREGSTGNFGHGVETLRFDNIKPDRPSVSIIYEGVDSTSTGFIGADVRFKPNATTKSYKAGFFEGMVEKDDLEGLADAMDKDEPCGAIRVETMYSANTQNWNLPRGPVTVVVVPYDQDGGRGETTSLLFTFDPEDLYGVKILESHFTNDSSNESYNPQTSLHGLVRCENLTRGWYVCMKTSGWNTQIKSKTAEEVIMGGTEMAAAFISAANSKSGRALHYTTLSSGTEYTLAMLLENQYGERKLLVMSAKTASASSSTAVDDFDKNVTMDDFIGSYLMTVGVGGSMASTSDKTFRVDIDRMDENRVVISGLASPIDGFVPMMIAYYDSIRHCLVLDSQNTGIYNGNYVQFSMYTGKSYSYSSGGFVLGMVDGNVNWVSSPDYTIAAVGYVFLNFNSPVAGADSYLGVLDSKVFVSPVMEPLEKAVSAITE